MDTEQPECKHHVSSIVSDFNKSSEKKAQKRENTLISFAMKAIARDQEKNILISRLQREIAKIRGMLNLLEMENDVKDKLMKEKEEEIEMLKQEIEMIKNTHRRRASIHDMVSTGGETPSKLHKFSDDVVISTQSNIVASPTSAAVNHNIVSSSKVESTEPQIDSSKSKAKIIKRRSLKRTKEICANTFMYNLRNRRSKSNNENAEIKENVKKQ